MIRDRLPNVISSRPFSNGSFSGFAKQTVNTTKTIESRAGRRATEVYRYGYTESPGAMVVASSVGYGTTVLTCYIPERAWSCFDAR
jgi:hypothetical protein